MAQAALVLLILGLLAAIWLPAFVDPHSNAIVGP
jgi:hypothetical protein